MLPTIIKANDQGMMEGRLNVIFFYLLLASPVLVILIIVNVLVNKNKKKAEQDTTGKTKSEVDQIIENSKKEVKVKSEVDKIIHDSQKEIDKPTKEPVKPFKLDYDNGERIQEKKNVQIYNPKKDEYQNFKVIITNWKFAIIKPNDDVYYVSGLKNIKSISHNKGDIYDYIFKNKKMLSIKSNDIADATKKIIKENQK